MDDDSRDGGDNADCLLETLDAEFSRSKAIQIASFLRDQTSLNRRFTYTSTTAATNSPAKEDNCGDSFNGGVQDDEASSSSDSETVERFSALMEQLKVRPQSSRSTRSMPAYIQHIVTPPQHQSQQQHQRPPSASSRKLGVNLSSDKSAPISKRAHQLLQKSAREQEGNNGERQQQLLAENNASRSSSSGNRLNKKVLTRPTVDDNVVTTQLGREQSVLNSVTNKSTSSNYSIQNGRKECSDEDGKTTRLLGFDAKQQHVLINNKPPTELSTFKSTFVLPPLNRPNVRTHSGNASCLQTEPNFPRSLSNPTNNAAVMTKPIGRDQNVASNPGSATLISNFAQNRARSDRDNRIASGYRLFSSRPTMPLQSLGNRLS